MIKHITETAGPKENEYSPYLTNVSMTYCQDPDNYSDNIENKLTLKTTEGGYFILESKRWAFDNVEEVMKVLMDFVKRIEFYE